MNGRASEGDGLGLSGVPMIHLCDAVCTRSLLAGKFTEGQWTTGDSILVERDRVLESHVPRSSGSKRQEKGKLRQHLCW